MSTTADVQPHHADDPTTRYLDLLEAEREAHDAILAAERSYRKALGNLRGHCPHTDLLEAGVGDDLHLLGAVLPIRICTTCGVEEETRTFRILTGPAAPVYRREIYAARKLGEPAIVGGSRLFTT